MEILKKYKDGLKWMAWVTIDDTHAELIEYDKTDAKALGKAQKIKDKNDRLKFVQSEIKRLNGTTHGI